MRKAKWMGACRSRSGIFAFHDFSLQRICQHSCRSTDCNTAFPCPTSPAELYTHKREGIEGLPHGWDEPNRMRCDAESSTATRKLMRCVGCIVWEAPRQV